MDELYKVVYFVVNVWFFVVVAFILIDALKSVTWAPLGALGTKYLITVR